MAGHQLEQHFLGRVFGVLAMAAHFNAEGENRMLQEFQGAGDALRIARAQKLNRLFEISAQNQAPSQQAPPL